MRVLGADGFFDRADHYHALQTIEGRRGVDVHPSSSFEYLRRFRRYHSTQATRPASSGTAGAQPVTAFRARGSPRRPTGGTLGTTSPRPISRRGSIISRRIRAMSRTGLYWPEASTYVPAHSSVRPAARIAAHASATYR